MRSAQADAAPKTITRTNQTTQTTQMTPTTSGSRRTGLRITASTLVSLAMLAGAGAVAVPARALAASPWPIAAPTAAPPAADAPPVSQGQPPHVRPRPQPLDEALALTPAQRTLWQAARTASRDAEAHGLELYAQYMRQADDNDKPDSPLGATAQLQDRLQDAMLKDRRAVRDRWIALDDSLDPAQRRRLRGSPEVAHWLGGDRAMFMHAVMGARPRGGPGMDAGPHDMVAMGPGGPHMPPPPAAPMSPPPPRP